MHFVNIITSVKHTSLKWILCNIHPKQHFINNNNKITKLKNCNPYVTEVSWNSAMLKADSGSCVKRSFKINQSEM